MGSERHSLRKQRFRVSAGSEDIALALQARLPVLNRTVLIDTIERVLDSYSSPAQHIRIDQLRVDLGTIVFGSTFDEDMKTSLERELRRALDQAVSDVESQPSSDRVARSPEEARLDLLEHYLTNGTLPFWATATAFDVEALVTEAATATPDGLARLLRRHRHASQVTRRLVAQLSDRALGQLLELIEPKSAGLVAGEIDAARREDRRFATWVRILTDAVFEHRDAAGGVAREAPQAEGGSDALSEHDGPEASPFKRQAAQSPGERPDLSRYDRAEAIRYYLRYGVLPWTSALAQGAGGDVPLSVERLLDTLPGLPVSVLRVMFPVGGGESPAALYRVVEQMSGEARARLLAAVRVEIQSHEGSVNAPITAGIIEEPGPYLRTILRLLHGGTEGLDATVEWPTGPALREQPALLSDVHWIKSNLAERARRGERPGRADVSSAALLQLLVEEHPADAEHFFRVLRSAGIVPAALLTEPVSPRLFAAAQLLLPAGARTIVALLLLLVSRLPAHEKPGDEGAIRTAVMGAVLDHVTVAGPADTSETRASLASGVLRALFGPVMAADTARQLATDAAQQTHDGEAGAEEWGTVSRALAAPGDAASAHLHPASPGTDFQSTLSQRLAQLPAAASRRIASLVRLFSAWPRGERLTGDEAIGRAIVRVLDEEAGVDPLDLDLLTAVLRRVLGPRVTTAVVGRLLEDVEGLAARGDLTRADVEAVNEAAASLTETSAQEPPEGERIAATLARRIDVASAAESGGPSSASLLRTLVARFPREARVFLQTTRDAGFRPSALLAGATAPELLEPVAGLLRPLDRRLVSLVLRIVSVLPAAERPGSDEATRTILAGLVLDHAGSPSSGEELAAAVLRRLLGPHVPRAVRRRLVTEVERAGRTGQVGPDAVTVLLRVLGRPEDTRGDTEDLQESTRGVGLPDADLAIDQVEAAGPATSEAPAAIREAATRDASTGPTEFPASATGEHPPVSTAESVAAALARLRGAAEVAREARASGEGPTAPVSDQPATPRLYQPSRFPRRAPPAAPPASDEPAAAGERVPDANVRRAQLSDDALRHILLELVDTSPAAVREFVVGGLAEPETRDRWVRSLTEPELARILWLLEPARHRVLIAAAESLFAAWDNAAPRLPDASRTRRSLWAFLLEVLSRHPEGERSMENLVPEFFTHVGASAVDRAGAAAPHDRSEVAERVYGEAVTLAQRKGHAHLRAVLSQRHAELIALATGQGRPPSAGSGDRPRASATTPPLDQVPSRRSSSRQRMAFSMGEDEVEADGEPIHIANAGLVIVGAFLPHLFTTLDVLEQAPTGKTRVRAEAVSRTVHMLQYLVDGRTDAPEPLLGLNKVLCGVPLATPIDREIDMTLAERELCDRLLAAVLAEWTTLKGSSVAALRETYLQREGRLDHLSTGWRLRVQRRTVDVLMDYITWPVATIAHSWMPEPLYVTW